MLGSDFYRRRLHQYFPRLMALMDRGVVRFDAVEKQFVGMAGDGQEVTLGHDPMNVERYLQHYPNPSDW